MFLFRVCYVMLLCWDSFETPLSMRLLTIRAQPQRNASPNIGLSASLIDTIWHSWPLIILTITWHPSMCRCHTSYTCPFTHIITFSYPKQKRVVHHHRIRAGTQHKMRNCIILLILVQSERPNSEWSFGCFDAIGSTRIRPILFHPI